MSSPPPLRINSPKREDYLVSLAQMSLQEESRSRNLYNFTTFQMDPSSSEVLFLMVIGLFSG